MVSVMYVDDTDLLHWADGPETTDEELIEKVQWELDVWVDIVNATGGILKVMQCSLLLLTYKWWNGRAFLKTVGQLPRSSHGIVTQHGSPDPSKDLSSLSLDRRCHLSKLFRYNIRVDRLVARGEVDDRQPRMPQTHAPMRRDPLALAVGAAVVEGEGGAAQRFARDRGGARAGPPALEGHVRG